MSQKRCYAAPRAKATGLLFLILALLLPTDVAYAQAPARVYRIGLLSLFTPTANPEYVGAFKKGLSELGYVEGRNLVFESRWAEGKTERLRELAGELTRVKPDVLVALATPPAKALQQATKTIPIVMLSGDPVGAGLVASLARPGGNVTGVASQGIDVLGKSLQILAEVLPGARSVAVLSNPSNQSHATFWGELEAAAPRLGLRLVRAEVSSPRGLEGAFAFMIRERVTGLIVLADPLLLLLRREVADLAARNRLPAMYGIREHVEAGGLMAYAPDLLMISRRMAAYVDRIVKGATPADLPVEQAAKFDLILNFRAAETLGLTFPQPVLQRADEVIR